MSRILLSILVCAGMVMAQGDPPPGPRGPWGGNLEALQSALDISEVQAQELAQFARDQHHSVMTELRDSGAMDKLRSNRSAIQELLSSGAADPAEVGALVIENDGLRKQIKAARDSAHAAVVGYVTQTLQRGAELTALEEAAKQQPAVSQARGLGLLAPPEGGPGAPGDFGPRMRRGGAIAPRSFGGRRGPRPRLSGK